MLGLSVLKVKVIGQGQNLCSSLSMCLPLTLKVKADFPDIATHRSGYGPAMQSLCCWPTGFLVVQVIDWLLFVINLAYKS